MPLRASAAVLWRYKLCDLQTLHSFVSLFGSVTSLWGHTSHISIVVVLGLQVVMDALQYLLIRKKEEKTQTSPGKEVHADYGWFRSIIGLASNSTSKKGSLDFC